MTRDAIAATLREWAGRFLATFTRRRTDEDLQDELRSHLELAAEDARRRGVPPRTTIAPAMDALRDQRGFLWLDDLARDVRHALRLLRRSPVFAAVAVLSLALAIGANAAIFSLADALLLRPLPVRDPGSLVTISADAPDAGALGGRLSYPNYRDLREAARSFDGLIAYQRARFSVTPSRETVPDMRIGMLVSNNYFEVLGVQPSQGRSFSREEGHQSGRADVVVLSDDFWRSSLGADPSVLGQEIRINGIGVHVIGVLPVSFTGTEPPLRPSFYLPAALAERLSPDGKNLLEDREARLFRVKGRLAPGVTRERARAELAAVWSALERQYPAANEHRRIAVRTELEDRVRYDYGDAIVLSMLAALAGIVLLIACANVANLMLARARTRSHEISVRLALGVSRSRLFRQLSTESLLIALLAFASGLGFAYAGIRFLRTIPVSGQVVILPQLDGRVVLFGLLAAILSAGLFGVAPARQSLRTDLVSSLKALPRGRQRRTLGRNVLVVLQVALAMVLLVAVGMLVNGLQTIASQDPGFRTDHILLMSFDTSAVRYSPSRTHTFYREIVDRAGHLPGAVTAGLASVVPFQVGSQTAEGIIPEGYQFPPGNDRTSTLAAVVGEHYFTILQIPIVRGRAFSSADRDNGAAVAIVNEQFAKTFWPGQEPLGKRIQLTDRGGAWVEVVGVTKTSKYVWVAEEPIPFLYLPFAQHQRTAMTLLVETRNTDSAALVAPLRGVVRAIDPDQPVFGAQTLSRLYDERTRTVPLLIMQVVGTMALLGLCLALVGLYGVIAYSVSRRTREIGIRMAVGAGSSQVLNMVLRQGLLLSGAGIVVGAMASAVVAPLLSAALLGLAAPSAATFVIVPAVLVALTLAASYVPARRASLVDPLVALREE